MPVPPASSSAEQEKLEPKGWNHKTELWTHWRFVLAFAFSRFTDVTNFLFKISTQLLSITFRQFSTHQCPSLRDSRQQTGADPARWQRMTAAGSPPGSAGDREGLGGGGLAPFSPGWQKTLTEESPARRGVCITPGTEGRGPGQCLEQVTASLVLGTREVTISALWEQATQLSPARSLLQQEVTGKGQSWLEQPEQPRSWIADAQQGGAATLPKLSPCAFPQEEKPAWCPKSWHNQVSWLQRGAGA